MKVVGKALILQNYKKLFENCLLLDLTTFIYVLYSKERFNNFKKFAKRQKLLYEENIALIKDWRKIALLLKVGN